MIFQAELDSIRSADAANKDQRIRREEQSEKDENELRILKASVEGLEGQNENLLEENAMLKMDLDELQESSTETDFCLRQELRGQNEPPSCM
jgi:regulator of replication initiation timing